MSASRRSYGTGQVYEKHGAYYARWRAGDGRRLNRRLGPIRPQGSRQGLTRREAERRFRLLQEEEEQRQPPVPGLDATVHEAAVSLRQKLAVEGARKSYLIGCRSMQQVHIDPRLGEVRLVDVASDDVEALAADLLGQGLRPKSVHNVVVFRTASSSTRSRVGGHATTRCAAQRARTDGGPGTPTPTCSF